MPKRVENGGGGLKNLPSLNKWCPVIQTENSQTKCMENDCAFWDDRMRNCAINVILRNIQSIELRLMNIENNI